MVIPVWVQVILVIGGVATALTSIIVLFYKLWPALTKFVGAMNALADLPQFMVTTAHTLADQDATLAGQAEQIKEIHHEVQFNNGSSVKDAVTRVEKVLTTNTKKLTTTIAAQHRIEKGVAGLYTRVDANEQSATKDRADIAAARQELEDTRPRRTIQPKE